MLCASENEAEKDLRRLLCQIDEQRFGAAIRYVTKDVKMEDNQSLTVKQRLAEALRWWTSDDEPVDFGEWVAEGIQFARAALAAYESAITTKSVAGGEAVASGITGGNGWGGAELERLSAVIEDRDALLRALEVIAVGDSKDPVRDAADELVALGHWRAEAVAGMRAEATPAPQPVALVPLTESALLDGFCKARHSQHYASVFIAGARFAERAHGIGLTLAGGEG
jgi:hypothetical protein